ncbi:uncharacterized protein LOC123319566 [Coccinella septempunctata]|uniref:uncharacterized protein LOC123319566 n=1 Tax=Coccinella septempunctata TaxID=41139 RepID=UPI001D07994C|nr:uncharacterized protein LOC123319566 [Coccinella septempunctata]
MDLNTLFVYSTLFFVWFCGYQTADSLQITHLFVPRQASHEASLDCRYSLEFNETLYDVKWYKDGSEFFRCKPNGHTLQFDIENIKLSISSKLVQPGRCCVTLIELNENTSGEYACEVSLEFPFNAKTKESRLDFMNSSLTHDKSSLFEGGAEFVKDDANRSAYLHNEASIFLSEPSFPVWSFVFIMGVNVLLKN